MGTFGNIWNKANDAYAKVVQPKQTDPLAFLAAGMPSSQDFYGDAMAQVGGAYQAQLGNLAEQERNAKGRQKSGDKALGQMYGELARDIGKNEKVLGGIYDTAMGKSRADTAASKQAINNQYTQTNNELGSLFSRLGIEDALPDSVAGGNQDRNMFASLVEASGNSARNAFGLDKSAALGFNRAQQNIAGLTGKNRRADLITQLNDALSGIGQQRNSVYGQMSDAVNSRAYSMQQDAMQREMQLQDMAFNMQLEQLKNAAAGGQGAGNFDDQWKMMGSDDKTAFKASSLVGDSNAPYAMDIISEVATKQNNGTYPNKAHFIRSVLASLAHKQSVGDPGLDTSALADLAAYYWDMGGVSKQPMQNPNRMGGY